MRALCTNDRLIGFGDRLQSENIRARAAKNKIDRNFSTEMFLKQLRRARGKRIVTVRDDVAIIRLEQLYPLRLELLQAALAPYPNATPVFWVQEEPGNMGAWIFMRNQFCGTLLDRPFAGITRPPSASPATGSHRRHKQEQAEIINRAFSDK